MDARTDTSGARKKVVIVGGGFGGLYAAQQLGKSDCEVTLIDRRNFHLFQPLLYQVATGGLAPGEIASPLRAILRRQKNTRVLQAEVQDFDVERKTVILSDGEAPYDVLILAAGVTSHYFGHSEWESHAPSLKTVEDALEIRKRVFRAFEEAERETDPEVRKAMMTFVIVGGGPTGVELAGAVGELAHKTLENDFRSIDPHETRILLIENGPRILQTYPEDLSDAAAESLDRLGVEILTGVRVTNVQANAVCLQTVVGESTMAAHTVLWAAGMKGSPLGQCLAAKTGAEMDRAGRVIINPDLSVPGHPNIYVIGDLAAFTHDPAFHGLPLPGVCQVAMQQGKFVADRLRLKGSARPMAVFKYHDRGSMAVIGRNAAVALIGRMKFSGFVAWVLWMFVHIMFLVEFDNKVQVFFEWAWSYLTWNRGSRLITNEDKVPAPAA